MTINFIPREYDGYMEFTADSSNGDFQSDQAAAWLTTAPVTYPHHSETTTTTTTT